MPDGIDKSKVSKKSNKHLRTSAVSKKRTEWKWPLKIFIFTFVLSMCISAISSEVLSSADYLISILVLSIFIIVGILFDIVGIAVASANEKPFHSMAARKVKRATEAVWLVRNAEKVSNLCNDVIGDISGVISGAAGAMIVARMVNDFDFNTVSTGLLATGIIAGVTVGGKAFGKSFALLYNTEIVFYAAKVIGPFFKKEKSRGK